MLVDDVGDVTITNDGATILKLLEVEHPAAKASSGISLTLLPSPDRPSAPAAPLCAAPNCSENRPPQILVELAELQDQEVGDGTTSVVIIAAELLKRANQLVRRARQPGVLETPPAPYLAASPPPPRAADPGLVAPLLTLDQQVRNKIHPTSIISGFRLAMRESCKYIQDHLAMKTDKLGKARRPDPGARPDLPANSPLRR